MNESVMTDLQTWCAEHNIIDKARQNFWLCFNNYKQEYPKEYSEVIRNENRKYVKIILDKIKICQNFKIDYGRPTVEIDYEITLNENYIGWYRNVYFFDGEFVDDFFVID